MSAGPPTNSIAFVGTVEAESSPGETVNVQTINPDGSNGPVVTGQTVDDGSGGITFETNATSLPAMAGYKAVASLGPDAQYAGAQSEPEAFDALESRTITLNKPIVQPASPSPSGGTSPGAAPAPAAQGAPAAAASSNNNRSSSSTTRQ